MVKYATNNEVGTYGNEQLEPGNSRHWLSRLKKKFFPVDTLLLPNFESMNKGKGELGGSRSRNQQKIEGHIVVIRRNLIQNLLRESKAHSERIPSEPQMPFVLQNPHHWPQKKLYSWLLSLHITLSQLNNTCFTVWWSRHRLVVSRSLWVKERREDRFFSWNSFRKCYSFIIVFTWDHGCAFVELNCAFVELISLLQLQNIRL